MGAEPCGEEKLSEPCRERGVVLRAPAALQGRDTSVPGLCHTQATSEHIPLTQPLQGLLNNFSRVIKSVIGPQCSRDGTVGAVLLQVYP